MSSSVTELENEHFLHKYTCKWLIVAGRQRSTLCSQNCPVPCKDTGSRSSVTLPASWVVLTGNLTEQEKGIGKIWRRKIKPFFFLLRVLGSIHLLHPVTLYLFILWVLAPYFLLPTKIIAWTL